MIKWPIGDFELKIDVSRIWEIPNPKNANPPFKTTNWSFYPQLMISTFSSLLRLGQRVGGGQAAPRHRATFPSTPQLSRCEVSLAALYCTVLRSAVLYFIVLHCTALHCTALYIMPFTVLHYTLPYTSVQWDECSHSIVSIQELWERQRPGPGLKQSIRTGQPGHIPIVWHA